MKDLQKMNLRENLYEDFKPKNLKKPLLPWRTKQKNHKNLKAKIEHEPFSQEERNWSKIEKIIQKKTVWTLQD